MTSHNPDSNSYTCWQLPLHTHTHTQIHAPTCGKRNSKKKELKQLFWRRSLS